MPSDLSAQSKRDKPEPPSKLKRLGPMIEKARPALRRELAALGERLRRRSR